MERNTSTRLLLDTVALIWALESPECISRKAKVALEKSDAVLEISAISLSEIAIKSAIGKLSLSEQDIRAGIADLRLRVLPYASVHALRLFSLPLHHSDPFDRQIIAQALSENIPVVTSEEKFRLYPGLRVIW
jgi:PIN domain nuclease of toxin-antitoxin system